MQKIVGILGEKGHGKDTFARLVQSETGEFGVTHFAEALKSMCHEIWGLTEEQLHDPVVKEEPLHTPVYMDEAIEAMRSVTGLSGIKPAGRVARTPREVMQFFGTEYVRATQDDYWVEQVRKVIRRGGSFLVPDTRFHNEADALREMGGLLIKIVRVDAPVGGDGHASETQQAAIVPDITVHTRTGDLRNAIAVAKALAAGFFHPVR